MTDTRDDNDDRALERFFEAGRAEGQTPAPDFMARLAADADAHLPAPVALPRPRPRLLGGWGLFASLASTVAVGVVIGVVLPETLLITDDLDGMSALLPGYGTSILAEGL